MYIFFFLYLKHYLSNVQKIMRKNVFFKKKFFKNVYKQQVFLCFLVVVQTWI